MGEYPERGVYCANEQFGDVRNGDLVICPTKMKFGNTFS